MRIYTGVSLDLITPQAKRIADEYIKQWQKKSLQSADLSSLVGELTGYELVVTDQHCNGWHNGITKRIALRDGNDTPYYTLFHEFGHAIQCKAEYLYHDTGLISCDVKNEWEAESLSWYLYNKCFPNGQMPSRFFNAYFFKEDLQYLINWYGSWRENDIEHLL